MAVTGIVLYGFVLGHMLGNLKTFQGAEKLDSYAEWLRDVGAPALPHEGALWIFRIVILVAVALHVWSAWMVTRSKRRARPERYAVRRTVQLDWASRTMGWSGVIILAYIVFHLLHLTIGWEAIHPSFEHGEVYANLVAGLENPLVAGFYILAVGLLGFHLYHGLWSMFQTLGLNHPRYNAWRRYFAIAFAVVISLGFMAVPIAILTGVVA
jgi:succinate dehydrogenase / fumarate reductase cytochrome b subunit